MKSAVLIFGIVVAIAASGCSSSGGGSEQKNVQADANPSASSTDTEYIASDAKGIQTITVKSSAVPDYLVLPAHIEADPTRVVHVFPPAGGRIVEMKVRPSDRVEKGQLLALLDSNDLSRAVADYHKAKVDAEVKQQALTRAQDLLAHHAIAEKDYQQAQGDAKIAQAEMDATAQLIRVFGMDPDHASTELRVVAPRSGVVLDIGAASGEYSKSLDAPQPLCTIADISTVWALGDIYERDFAGLKMGEEAQVTLDAYPDQRWPGRVGVLSDAVDPITRTLHLRVVLANPGGRIKPAMFGSIRVLRSSSTGILVPASAVIREGSEAHVFVSKGNGRFERRTVKLGRALDGSIEILSGINQGDSIVSEGALLLRAAVQS
ncbi:MAG: efflux RND transporter periplasmic adaptor subunit [Candidatus Acidiferrales bacterium]|jgi:cobalt-zinc-cadmium efflux system membrane fusion protein